MNFKSEIPEYKFSRLKSSTTHRMQSSYTLIPLTNSGSGIIAKHLQTNNL
jgi:hypothetical protein